MEGLLPDTLNSDSVLADKRVRQAIEYAIDRPAIIKALGHGFWKPLNQLATEKVCGYNPDIPGRHIIRKKLNNYWQKRVILAASKRS